MNKASKALRRSSIRLKSFSSGHSELNLIVSDIKDVRSAAKQFLSAQETAWKDMGKWASSERNEAIRETFSCLVELNRLWAEVQTDFIEQLNKFKYTFEIILEGETSVDKMREHLNCAANRETKYTKELEKAVKKNNFNEVRQLEQRINDTRSSIKSTQVEISEKTHENEAVKVIRLKEGLLKLSESYVDMAQKSSVIFNGCKSIAEGLPELEQPRGMHNVRFRGSEVAKQKVSQVKEMVKTYRPNQAQSGAPPPYSSPPQQLYPSTNHQPLYPSPPQPFYTSNPQQYQTYPYPFYSQTPTTT